MKNTLNSKSQKKMANFSDFSYFPQAPVILEQHSVILLTYGEISLKSERVRKRLENRLMKDIKFRLTQKNIPFKDIFRDRGRIYISALNSNLKSIIEIIPKCLGVYTYSPASVFNADMQVIFENVKKYAKSILKRDFTFGFRTRVVGNKEFHSQALAAKLGELILDEFKPTLNISVNLTNPDIWFHVEVRNNKVYLYHEKIKTPWVGNPIELPSGILGLMTDDISDFISSFLAAKRGFFLVPVLFTYEESLKYCRNPIKIASADDYLDKKEILRTFIDYFPIKTLYGLKIDLSRIIKNSAEIISKFKNNLGDIDGINKDLIIDLDFPIMQHLKLRIGEWILKNYETVFLELEKRSGRNLEAISNILRPLSKKRANRRDLTPGREFVKLSAITDGDYMEIWRSFSNKLMKDIVFPVVESSENLIYRAAFPFNDSEIKDLFIKIDPILASYIPESYDGDDKSIEDNADGNVSDNISVDDEVSDNINVDKENNSDNEDQYDIYQIRKNAENKFNQMITDVFNLNGFTSELGCIDKKIVELVEIKRE